MYHSKTEHYLPEDKNPMNLQINNLLEFTETNQMKINKLKTKIMLFNRSRSLDFQPNIQLESELLEVVEESKILGVIMSSDMKWKKHIDYIRKKCFTKMWSIRRMKEIGASTEEMLDVFSLQIRCLTEMGCPAWNGSTTIKDKNKLEAIQKTALRIILGDKYGSYQKALETLKLHQLDKRRELISKRFARNIERSPKFSNWLTKAPRTNRYTKKYYVPKARTTIYQKSPLFYLTNLLN